MVMVEVPKLPAETVRFAAASEKDPLDDDPPTVNASEPVEGA
jgi:hypothetical protein